MDNLRVVLVVVENNDFQALQVADAQAAAARLGVSLDLLEIEHDAVEQSVEIMKLLQRPADTRPHAILFEPVGTTLAQPASAAAAAGVAWVVLNRTTVDYIPEQRALHHAHMFTVSTSHLEVGHLQGEQIKRLLPGGGTAVYIEGPTGNEASRQRTTGMMAAKPVNVALRVLKGSWTEASGYRAVELFLNLSTSRDVSIDVVAAQNDAMALGARRAFHELTSGAERERYSRIPYLGCDGLPKTGQEAVRSGQLAATVVIPPNAGRAVETLVAAIRTRQQPPERISIQVTSYPALSSIAPAKAHRG